MEIKEILIENFRNFDKINFNVSNRNIIFGLNDVGKTNFLCALRFLLDYKFRQQEFIETDFHNCDINKKIVIQIHFNIKDIENPKTKKEKQNNEDNKKFRAKLQYEFSKCFDYYIKLEYEYNSEIKLIMQYSYDGSEWEDCNPKGMRYDIDNLFEVIYIDSEVSLQESFKNRAREYYFEQKRKDSEQLGTIDKQIGKLNMAISKLSFVKDLQEKTHEAYEKLKPEDGYSVKILSEVQQGTLYNNIKPYMCKDKHNFPTSGDGRKKIMAYGLLGMESLNSRNDKIKIYLIEEIENHLHRNMQLTLSKQLFGEEPYFDIFFLNTHSTDIVSYMDNVSLIKLAENISKSASVQYSVPKEYMFLKHKLNSNLINALYSNKCFLVEGPSEEILFEKIITNKKIDYLAKGYIILSTNGIGFKDYLNILRPLKVDVICKTDNDIKVYNKKNSRIEFAGFNRAIDISEVKHKHIPSIKDKEKIKEVLKNDNLRTTYQEKVINKQKPLLKKLNKNKIYLSLNDLENDLHIIIPDKINKTFGSVKKMQDNKQINMIKLCQILNKEECELIFENENFICLKEFVK